MYTVICQFHERFDGGRVYKVGELYPRGGFTPPEGRAAALAIGKKSLMNNTGSVYLNEKQVADEESSAVEPKKRAPRKANT